jgi:hypothetical protein
MKIGWSRGEPTFGASGASGQEFVSSALERGHTVRVFLRPSTTWSAASQVQVCRGTFNDLSLLQDAVAGVDAVCSFIGPRPPNTDVFCAAATQAILNAMAVQRPSLRSCCHRSRSSGRPPLVHFPDRPGHPHARCRREGPVHSPGSVRQSSRITPRCSGLAPFQLSSWRSRASC